MEAQDYQIGNYMANYVYIENNFIKSYYDVLPQNWRNISGFNLIDDKDHLESMGWYQVVKNNVDYDPNSQILKGCDYKFENGQVYEIPIFENFTPIPEKIIIKKETIPKNISAMQLRLWLFKNGILTSDVEKAIDSVEDESVRQELMIKWEYASSFERNNMYIDYIASYLGLSEEDVDRVFLQGSKYT